MIVLHVGTQHTHTLMLYIQSERANNKQNKTMGKNKLQFNYDAVEWMDEWINVLWSDLRSHLQIYSTHADAQPLAERPLTACVCVCVVYVLIIIFLGFWCVCARTHVFKWVFSRKTTTSDNNYGNQHWFDHRIITFYSFYCTVNWQRPVDRILSIIKAVTFKSRQIL